MAKATVQTISSLQAESQAIQKINTNFATLAAAIEKTLSRDGTVPNAMTANFDMNGRRILNLPVPTSPTEPARHGDIQQYVDQAEAYADEAGEFADDAEESAEDAAASAAQAEQALLDLRSRYVGSFATAPTENEDGSPLLEGALYFNTALDLFYVYTVRPVNDLTPEITVEAWEPLPVNEIRSMGDIALSFNNNDTLVWNTGQARFIAKALAAENVAFDITGLPIVGLTVQDAIEEILTRVTLNVYDIHFFFEGLLGENQRLYTLGTLRQFTVPNVTTGWVARAEVASTGTQVLLLKKNGTQFGTITFTSSTTGVWSIPGATTFNPGDLLQIDVSGSADTTIKGISVNLSARRGA